MSRWWASTLQFEPWREFIDRIVDTIERLLLLIRLLDDKIKQTLRNAVKKLAERLLKEHPATIPTVVSHGDFQAGNILWDGDRAMILDWEYAGRRSAWYDVLVYGLEFRSGGDSFGRLQAFVHQGKLSRPQVISMDALKEAAGYQSQRNFTAGVFALEEVIRWLTELTPPPIRSVSNYFYQSVREFDVWSRAR